MDSVDPILNEGMINDIMLAAIKKIYSTPLSGDIVIHSLQPVARENDRFIPGSPDYKCSTHIYG